MVRAWPLVGLLLVAVGCTSEPVTRTATEVSLPASPQFCDWAQAIVDSAPSVEPAAADEALDNERLVDAGAQLVRFADTLEGAATHAPTDRQADFTLLAGFNREVATVIVGERALQEELVEGARTAADRVAATIDEECALRFDPTDGLAFTGRP